jgi:phosphoribosyl-AMP cyclohydrolase / phosphoribosyl-ATP pyrophosphohydrolase
MSGEVSMTNRRIEGPADLEALSFQESGLLPVVAQDAVTGDVLMVAWANRSALELTMETGQMHYWSRSRRELWHKGATSENYQDLISLHADCDGDTLLARVTTRGPACHTGDATCFGELRASAASPAIGPEPGAERGQLSASGTDLGAEPAPSAAMGPGEGAVPTESTIPTLWAVLEERAALRPDSSYTVRLLDDENLRLKKLGEETAELILALSRGDRDRILEEAADLVYHLLVALKASGGTLEGLLRELETRKR